MSIEGQGHFLSIYFPGFVCFVLYYAKISGERLQDHWSSWFFSLLLKELIFVFLFVVTAAGALLCGSPKKQPRSSAVYIFLLVLRDQRNILRNQKNIICMDPFIMSPNRRGDILFLVRIPSASSFPRVIF